jgi:hypothetical protein
LVANMAHRWRVKLEPLERFTHQVPDFS